MSEEYKTIARRFYGEVLSQGRVDVVEELAAPGYVEHEELPAGDGSIEGVKQFISTLREAFPDLRAEPQQMVAEGDMLAIYSIWTGTHQGDFMGAPGTGRSFSISCADFVRFEGGKVVEHWGVTDFASMMEQLGLAPQTQGAATA